ncbi:E3 ubiquitin-protein ligase DTX1 [Takifugu flavidus]|uniref:E3 ubiquitin-protein ligase DTX1 n=1 Tax=Takifugu flavidus TaxID=433684 RepID=A0A5C6N2B8_9TELE|nr:E3 ubiquitin-protein ligase DTX1 [Takifugu flavidus]
MARPGSGLLVPVNGLGYPPQNMARVVVWEWLNEHGRWRPYGAAVCHHIENVLKGDARGSVVLGQVDGQLSPTLSLRDLGCLDRRSGLPLGPSHFVEALLIVLGGGESWLRGRVLLPCGLGRSSRGWEPDTDEGFQPLNAALA